MSRMTSHRNCNPSAQSLFAVVTPCRWREKKSLLKSTFVCLAVSVSQLGVFGKLFSKLGHILHRTLWKSKTAFLMPLRGYTFPILHKIYGNIIHSFDASQRQILALHSLSKWYTQRTTIFLVRSFVLGSKIILVLWRVSLQPINTVLGHLNGRKLSST